MTAGLHFVDALGPCDGCKLCTRCASESLACQAFAAWMRNAPWQCAARVPDRATYQRTVGSAAKGRPRVTLTDPPRPRGRPRKVVLASAS